MHVEVELLVDADGLDELRPLWLALRDHHGAVAPGLGPVRDDEDSWARRRANYAEWIAEPDAFVLVARDEDGRALGYAFVTVNDGSPTWEHGRYGCVETLSVDPERRGEGIGQRLLDAVHARLDGLGVGDSVLSYAVGNEGAARFYAREGYEPVFVTVRRTQQP